MGGQLQPRTSMAGAGFDRGGQQQQQQQHMEAAPPTGASTGAGGGGGASGGPAAGAGGVDGALKQLSQANEKAWGTLGSVSRSMENDAQALESYERALVHNPYSPSALAGLGGVHKARGDYRKVRAFAWRLSEPWIQVQHKQESCQAGNKQPRCIVLARLPLHNSRILTPGAQVALVSPFKESFGPL